jgi:hypothetical protein
MTNTCESQPELYQAISDHCAKGNGTNFTAFAFPETLLNPRCFCLSVIEISRMAHIADLDEDKLTWYNSWYLREETLKAANNVLVNCHYHQPLSQIWGGGIFSSSDGQRFPVSGKVRIAEALPRYFGYVRCAR